MGFVLGALSLQAVEIGVVNMERLIQLHPRTAQDRAILERYVKDFETERDERVAALRKLSEELDTLRQESEDIGLTAKAIAEKRERAQLKLEALREGEMALREMAAKRQQELTNEEMRMRDRVIGDINRVLAEVAEDKKLDVILDGGQDPAGGYGAVVYSKPSYEITDAVLVRLRSETEGVSEEE
jgi:Skp family chaperone for outer membrane proteins